MSMMAAIGGSIHNHSVKMRPSSQRQRPTKLFSLMVGFICGFWLYLCVWQSQQLIDRARGSLLEDLLVNYVSTTQIKDSEDTPIDYIVQRRGEPRNFAAKRRKGRSKTKRDPQNRDNNDVNGRYIIFQPNLLGQGAGNIIHGLLAVHALAEEFDRLVCHPEYKEFHIAFQPVDSRVSDACRKLKNDGSSIDIRLVNYEGPVDECLLKQRLESNEPIIYILGNTYPRWRPIPTGYFQKFYQPTSKLQALLPKPMPKTVVHLRQGDKGYDKRQGLDNATFAELGKALPSDTYLVTNQLSWYDYFSSNFGWRHPNWHAVQHSASRSFMWDNHGELTKQDETQETQHLQMWSDWYAMACANQVWHTHSDFSLSAIHWMNVDSRTIKGVDPWTNKLKLIQEAFRTDDRMMPLKDRGPDDLKYCAKHEETNKDLKKGFFG
jgi:hypothetical protein